MGRIKRFFRAAWQLLSDTITGFSDHNITKLGASLAYYTVFSMGPLLVVLISLCGIFFRREAVEGKVYGALSGFVGRDTAAQLQAMIRSAGVNAHNSLAAIIGIATLLLGATSVFSEIQDSINRIWGLKPKPKRGWVKLLQNRFLSFSIVVSLGFILLVSLTLTTLVEGLGARLQHLFPHVMVAAFYIFNLLMTLGVSMLIFAIVFRVLPDANIRWKDVIVGALATAILFLIGKFAISLYISKTRVGSTYGAAGSLVVLLVWIYYSSIILYTGAAFTKAYAVRYGSPIKPDSYAVTTKEVEIETNAPTLQQNEQTEPVAILNKKQAGAS